MELTDKKYNPFVFPYQEVLMTDSMNYTDGEREEIEEKKNNTTTLLDYYAAHAPPAPEAFKVDFDGRPEIMDQAHHGERSVVEFLLMQEGKWHFKYPRLREYISDSGHFDWKKLEDSKPRKGSKRKTQATAFLDEVIGHMEDDLKWVTAYAVKKIVAWRWTYAKMMLAERWHELNGPVPLTEDDVPRGTSETQTEES